MAAMVGLVLLLSPLLPGLLLVLLPGLPGLLSSCVGVWGGLVMGRHGWAS
jgi:hypothetical protein